MGIGYVIGCLVSIVLWKFDRSRLFGIIDNYIFKFISSVKIVEILYFILMILFFVLIHFCPKSEIINALTAFLVIDISNAEKEIIDINSELYFHESISRISYSIVCGFTAPLFLIILFGNEFAVIYMMIYHLGQNAEYKCLKFLLNIFSVIPSLIVQAMLYLVYMLKTREFTIDFKGEYVLNNFVEPTINVDVIAANILGVGFYYFYYDKKSPQVINYGSDNTLVENEHIKGFINMAYMICIICFIFFFMYVRR